MHIRTSFSHETTHEDLWIPLPDGTRLHARVWRPLTDAPVPALLEYLPDRLTDRTAPRDWQRHPWYAGHGYASVRVDARGHGNSEGVPADPYGESERADGVEVIHWLADRPWCSGAVGMFGISRGGFTSLRIAALAPEPLKAIVTVCATDDPYDNDGHRLGGAVLAVETHARAATALADVARPPDPVHVGQVMWRDMWVKRLEKVEPFIHTWLSHPTRDAYWRHAGVREDGGYGGIRAAVLAVGGWHDPSCDTVLRLVESLPADRVRGLIGPWCHQYPDRGLPPGPAIGFLQETLRWWDHWLRPTATSVPDPGPGPGPGPGVNDDPGPGVNDDPDPGVNGRAVMAQPLLRSYVMAAHPPATTYPSLPGHWVGDTAWPSPSVTPIAYALRGAPVLVRSPQHTGVDAGRFRPVGNDADMPPNQREEDARSVCFEFEVPGETWILGRPRVRLRLTSHSPWGQVIARVCDVAADGSSTLVTRGALNLSARYGPDQAVSWKPGSTEDVVFDLTATGYAFPSGHRIRLSLSSAYWPWIWPQPGSAAGLVLDPAGSSLELPVRARESDPRITFEEPEQSEPLGVTSAATLDEPRPERLVARDVARGEWRLEVDPRQDGTRVHPDGLECTEDARDTYTIDESDPLSARTRSTRSIRLHRPELPWDARVETRSELSCDAREFITSNELICKDGNEVVFHRTWERRIPRTPPDWGPGGGMGNP
ncbi:CocE/NonD family hydrolase [Streptomyces sp. S1A1-8]|uniref:CocE/NonD family hydrolase n=1 Tax=unclassified Streptomyces TaxID=2593676 RepID=UPI0011658A88|nr:MULTISPECIES: CocE/NonD family hydrolase [unclassified Streptomyces]QDO04530.1 CocE/NonD family hydrolase [Streptomyces sp. RLB1-9]QDO26319.1 CocE/NonD family hydrolase [Streptomyces sp. S1A1-8]QDO36430.1 CocE/NonD family hydrolase [Streptomyces sp. S1A1-3]